MVTQLRQAPLSASPRAGFRTGLRPLVAALLLALCPRAFALPTDPTVVAGQAVVRGAGGNSLVIDQASGKAAIDWRSFNIGAGEAVRFNQPSAAAMTVNRVTSNNPSEILGLITAPGSVFLINPSGIIFGRSAVVDVGSLVASTLTASTADLLTGRAVFTAAPGGSGAVRNEGSIVAAPGGSVSLIGTRVSNSGSISTPGGTTGLIAGERVSVDFEGDGLVRYQVDAAAARALVEHSGQISADGGRVALQAGARDVLVDTVLNVEGVVRARGISQRGGEIYLDGGTRGSVLVSGTLDASGTAPGTAGGQLRVLGENVGLVGSARLDASGDAGGGSVLVGGNYQGGGPEHNATRAFVGSGVTINADALARGNGGRVITWADDWTRFYGTVSARGGAAGGDGGFVEVSGKQNLAFAGSVVTTAPQGRTGTLLLDPGDLYLGMDPSPAPPATAGTVPDFAGSSGFDYFIAAGSFATATNYTLSATQDVIFLTNLGFPSTSGQLVSIQAGRDIWQAGGVTSISTQGAGLRLTAGASPSGTGGVTLAAGINTNGGTLTISADGASQLSGAFAGGVGGLVKEGAGTLSLSNGSNSYSGGTTIRGGTLRAAAASALPAGGAVSLEGSGILDLADRAYSIGSLSGTSGTGIVLGNAGTGGLVVSQASDGSFDGVISGSGPSSGTGTLAKQGPGALALGGTNTFTGLTQVSEGVLRVSRADGLNAASSLRVTGTGSFEIDNVAFNSLASLTLAGGLQGDAALAGRGNASYAGTVTLVGHASVRAAGASDVLTLTGLIDGQVDTPVSADPTLIKQGDGTLVLGGSGTNFFPEIMAGTLRAASSGVLPDKETRLGPGATLDISDTTQTIGHLLGGDSSSSVVLGTSGALTVHQGLEGAYAGSISGGGSSFFIKDGSAALHLSGASPLYSGTTQVLAGLLSAGGSGNVLGSGAVQVSGGATLGIDGVTLGVTSLSLQGSGVGGGGALTGVGTAAYGGPVTLVNPGPVVVGVADGGTLSLGGALSGVPAMSVVKQGPGTLALGGASAYGGGTTIASGTLVAQHADALGSGQVEVATGATLKIDGVALNAGALTLNGNGVGSGGALQGAGTASYGGTVALATASAIGATTATDVLTVSGPLTGSGSLAKVGAGSVRLPGSNDYAGGTTVSAGTLVAQHATALGTGAAGVSAGATLEIDNVALATGGLTLNGSGVGGAGALLGRGSASHAGAVTLATASAIGAPTLADTLILTSPVSGAGSLSKVGAGTLQLPGGNSYAGGTTVEAGTLRLSGVSPANLGALSLTGAGTLDLNDTQQSIGTLSGAVGAHILLGSAGTGGLTVNQAGDGNFAGVISGSGPSSGSGALNKLGAGTLTLSGANTFTGLTRVAAGVLRVSRADALDTASSLLVTGSGSFEIDNVAFNSLASLTLAGGNVGQESLAGLGAASYGGTVTLLGFGRVAAASASDALTLSGRIDGQTDLGADPTLTKAGAGTVTLSGTGNTYAGGTTIEAGTLVAQQAGALGTGPVTVDAGATLEIDNVTLATGGLTLGGSGVGGTGALRGRGSASHTGTVTLATASAIGTPTPTDTLSLNSPLTGQSLTKVGSGTLNLSGISSYAGGTTVAGGTLHLSAGAVLPSLGAVSLAGGGILELNEANQRIGNLSGLAGTGISLGSGSLTVSQASDGSFAGTLGGSGDLIKQGTASLTLSGVNTTYTGTTRVQAGTLVAAGSGSALGTGAVQVSGGATLEIDGVALATGGLTLNGSGVGGAGALRGRGTASHSGAVTLATASAIGAAASDTLRLANPITGQALTKVGAGTVELSGSNSYAGGTTVEAGRLRLLAGASLPSLGAVSLTGSGVLDLNGTSQSIGNLSGASGTTIALGNGTLTLTQSAAGSFAGLVTGSGNLTKQGSARLALSGASTGYSGTTRVQAGTLAATGSGSALGTGAVQVSDGATLVIDGVTLGVSSISLRGAGVGGLGALTGTGGAGYSGALSLTGPAAIGVAAAGDTLSLGGVLSGDATAGLTKLGAGTLRLSGASVHAGGTTIGAGSIEAAGDDALGTGAVRVEAGSLNVGTATLGNAIELAGGALNAVGVAQLAGNVSQTVDSRISAASAPASLTLLQAFAGGGHGLTIDGPGDVNLSGGASGLAAVVQNAGSQLGLGTGQRVVSSGAQTYGGVVTGHDVTLISSTRQAITADSGGNDFTGTLWVTAGDTTIRDANALSVLLDTGATTLIAGQVLTVAGSADSLVTDSAALVFGATRVAGEGRFTARGPVSQRAGEALQVGGASAFDAGSQALSLTEAANSFGGRVTLKAGDTALRGSDSLDVALDGTGATALSAGQALTLAGRADSLVTDSAALLFGATRVAGEGRFTARGPVSQRAGEALQVGGASA
ncbi:autotransporter-associated beta strand repeat-containing protein, partial [uncultured Zoogloea sp.]|uniref:autotransporter-associated beta strand repeat-containing protein n=1 Tax=uncultured Zoogloea sp. TaxID=160237 RepID=UPI00263727C9